LQKIIYDEKALLYGDFSRDAAAHFVASAISKTYAMAGLRVGYA